MGLAFAAIVAGAVYRHEWRKCRTAALAEFLDVFDWCQGCNELAPRASMDWLTPELYRCDACRGVPTLRRLAELREAANRPNKPQGETRVSPAPGSDIFRTRPPARANVSDARSREAGSEPSVSNTHFLGTA